MMPCNEISPPMLAGPKRTISGPKRAAPVEPVIADNWRGLYGSDLFSSMLRVTAFRVLPNRTFRTNISLFAVFFQDEAGGSPIQAGYCRLAQMLFLNPGIPEFVRTH
jgi:hypothetical protein